MNSYVPGIYYVTFDREIVLRGCRDEETEAQELGPFLEIILAWGSFRAYFSHNIHCPLCPKGRLMGELQISQ